MYVDLNSNLKLKTSYNQGITLSAWVYIENNTSVDSFRYIVDLLMEILIIIGTQEF